MTTTSHDAIATALAGLATATAALAAALSIHTAQAPAEVAEALSPRRKRVSILTEAASAAEAKIMRRRAYQRQYMAHIRAGAAAAVASGKTLSPETGRVYRDAYAAARRRAAKAITQQRRANLSPQEVNRGSRH